MPRNGDRIPANSGGAWIAESRRTEREAAMNASELLGGHEVEQLFGRLASIDASDRKALRALARELEARVATEERTLYPIARTTESAEDAPSFTVAATVLARMESGPFDPKLAALMDLIDEDVRADDDLDVADV